MLHDSLSLSRADLQDKAKVFLGCLVEALALVAVCMSGLVKGKKLQMDQKGLKEALMLALTLAAVLCVADLYAPALGRALRQGAGFGIGASLVGFP